jgi:uncharacterized RDD family membrane protein YckC
MTEPQQPTEPEPPADAKPPGEPPPPAPAAEVPAAEVPAAEVPAAAPQASQWASAPPPPVAAAAPAVSWQAPSEAVGPAPGIEFAGHGARLVAYIFDSLIISAIFLVLFFIGSIVAASGATVVGDRVTNISGMAAAVFTILFIIAFAVVILYFPFFWARGGQTPGMRPFGLRVVRDADGSRIGWGTALLRLIGLWVAAAVFYLGFIWIFIDKRRRGWQDLIAGTVVVKQP